MTKQEEIREGIAQRIWDFRRSVSGLQANNEWEGLLEGGAAKRLTRAMAKEIMGYEDSQGVVIKVDRELPENPYELKAQQAWDINDGNSVAYKRWYGYRRCLEDMAGYVAVEPLTGEL